MADIIKSFEIEEEKLQQTMELISEIADLYENGSTEDEILILKQELEQLTGKTDIDTRAFAEYWGWTSLDTIARSLLMPEPQKQNLSNEEIKAIVINICECRYSESENNYYIKLLKMETGLINLSDYIYYPDNVGLKRDAEPDEIADKILHDRK